MNNRAKDRRLTTDEAAALLGYSPATLRTWRVRGGGPDYIQPRGPGGKVLYWLSALRRWQKTGGGR